MRQALFELQTRLEKDLTELEATTPNLLKRFLMGAELADRAGEELKRWAGQHDFASEEEEIFFFKYIQPGILSRKIYYSRLFRLEAGRPKILREDYRKFLFRELQRIDMFFEEHQALHLYVSSGATDKDEQYFLRNSRYNNEYPVDLAGMLDTRFCTVTSFKLAELMGLRDVGDYIAGKLENWTGPLQLSPKPRLRWTDSKTDLVELVYALYSAGSFNNGVAELKQIFEWLESSLEIDIGHAYSHFRDIRMRKKEIAIFLSRLRSNLLRRIEELGERTID
ncbi:RteC domain-containing protein [Chitinophaga lutea]|nr:RteC domain-containing protein [Chitinophaga lutea]